MIYLRKQTARGDKLGICGDIKMKRKCIIFKIIKWIALVILTLIVMFFLVRAIGKAIYSTDISTFKCNISESFFTDNQFNINSVNTKTFIALLASKTLRSFISGGKVDLATTLKLSSSKEFHHIFPDKYLQRLGKERRERYQLANFCFLNNADNQKIKDKAPDEYIKYLNPESVSEVLCAAICPENTFELSYDEFIDKRKKMLSDYAKSLID